MLILNDISSCYSDNGKKMVTESSWYYSKWSEKTDLEKIKNYILTKHSPSEQEVKAFFTEKLFPSGNYQIM